MPKVDAPKDPVESPPGVPKEPPRPRPGCCCVWPKGDESPGVPKVLAGAEPNVPAPVAAPDPNCEAGEKEDDEIFLSFQ